MMKILKEAINNQQQVYRPACNLIAGKSAQNLIDLLTGKANKNDSKKVTDALIAIAIEIDKGNQDVPKAKSEFLTRHLSNQNGQYSIDFKNLVREKECNPLSILGLLSIPLYYDALKPSAGQNTNPYQKFLSMFSENGNFDDLSYILLGEFTEAFNVDNIDNNNEFINRYLRTNLFTNLTRNRKSFEKVYNSYVNDNVFDKNSIRKLLK